jgi:hypothetical protein
MIRFYILDEQGEPIELDQSDPRRYRFWEELDRRRVGYDLVGDVVVSTVFFTLQGRPVLWETLVQGGRLDGQIARYTSRADAIEGHERTLAQVWRVEQIRVVDGGGENSGNPR